MTKKNPSYIYKSKNLFWKNKRILITGHTGFVGSWLTNVLLKFNAKVFGYSLKPQYKNSIYDLSKLKKRMNGECINDINNYKIFYNFIKKIKPQFIFHLAAQPLVIHSYKDPLKTYKTNVLGTANVLEASKNIKSVKSILIVTSDKVYLNNNNNNKKKFKESDQLGGGDHYSSSKAASEIVASTYSSLFYNKKGSPYLATVRAGNIIGGGDWGMDRLIPDIMKNYIKNKPTTIRNPNHIRPWQHIIDVVQAYLKISENLYKKRDYAIGSWNIGPTKKQNIKVIDLVKKIKKVIPKIKIKILKNKINKMKESKVLMINNKKFLKIMKQKQLISFNSMIDLTSNWYLKFKEKKINCNSILQTQINRYFF